MKTYTGISQRRGPRASSQPPIACSAQDRSTQALKPAQRSHGARPGVRREAVRGDDVGSRSSTAGSTDAASCHASSEAVWPACARRRPSCARSNAPSISSNALASNDDRCPSRNRVADGFRVCSSPTAYRSSTNPRSAAVPCPSPQRRTPIAVVATSSAAAPSSSAAVTRTAAAARSSSEGTTPPSAGLKVNGNVRWRPLAHFDNCSVHPALTLRRDHSVGKHAPLSGRVPRPLSDVLWGGSAPPGADWIRGPSAVSLRLVSVSVTLSGDHFGSPPRRRHG